VKKKTNWKIGTDDVGQRVLRWDVGRDSMDREDADPLAQTYNFLKRLELAGLSLADESAPPEEYDPYNTGVHSVPVFRREPDDT